MDAAQRYENNIAYIQTINPALIQKIKNHYSSINLELDISRKGDLTCYIKKDNRKKYFYSAFDPIKEVGNWLEPQNLTNYDNILLFGFGLGHETEFILSRYKNIKTIHVFEASIDFFLCALKNIDLATMINSRRVILHIADKPEGLAQNIKKFKDLGHQKNKFLLRQELITPCRHYYEELKGKLVECIKSLHLNTMIEVHHARHFRFENIFHNMLTFSKSYSAGYFSKHYPDIPAICVGGGPSLDNNIEDLKAYQNSCIIISCDGAAQKLFKHGITPHFITTADPFQGNLKKLNSAFEFTKGIPLIADVQSNYKLVEQYLGPVFFSGGQDNFSTWLKSICNDFKILDRGVSVALMSYFFALDLNCKPIILMGQDLCFTKEKYASNGYSSDTGIVFDEKKKPYLIRKNMGIEGLETIRTPLQEAFDIHNQPVYTFNDFILCKNIFQDYIRYKKIKTYNATEAGLPLSGAENIKLKELGRYIKLKNFSKNFHSDLLHKKIPALADEQTTQAIELLSTQISRIVFLCLEAKAVLASATASASYIQLFKPDKLQEILSELFSFKQAYQLIGEVESAQIYLLKEKHLDQLLEKPLPETIKKTEFNDLSDLFDTFSDGSTYIQNYLKLLKPQQ